MRYLTVRVARQVTAMVKKLPNGQYRVVKHDGTGNLGTYDTKGEAEERLRQVEYFKHKG
jgi:alkylated DNA nucleotide flippase Atl1